MKVHFILDNIIDSLATKLESKAHKEEKFSTTNEYTLPNVTEEKLLEVGFEFISYDSSHKYPIYRYENLEAYFDQGVLHLYEVTV